MTESLNAQIARLLGYQINHLPGQAARNGTERFEIIAPDGARCHAAWYPNGNDWSYIIAHVIEVMHTIPDWEHDANAALGLPLPDGFSVERMADYWWAKIPLAGGNRYSVNGYSAAEVVCKCFVEYRLWEKEPAP